MRRRTFLGTSAGTLATLLAGCSGDGGSGSENTETTTGEPTDEPTETPIETTAADTSYTVTMAPVGDVTFEEVPKSWLVYESGYADMGVALGQADGLLAVGNKSRYHTDYYEDLSGVSVDKKGLTQLLGDSYQIDKELFLELNADVHIIDPQWLLNNGYFKLEKADLEQIESSVGPFIGNTIFRRTDKWHDYRYYTMYGAFEKVAQIFRKQDQFRAFKSFHDDYVARVQAKLPAADQRPNALLCFAKSNEPEKFYPYRLSDQGTNKKQFHDLGISDALAGTGIQGLSTNDRGQIDYEAMLEVDPDAILLRGHEGQSAAEFRSTVLAFMKEHDVASQLTAVQNGNVFRGGPIYQGPIMHLFNLERAATDFFPDTFSGTLFDRDEVSAIVNGEF